MNICFVNMPLEYYSPVSGGAVATVTAELAAELEQLGHGVQVVTYTDGNPVHEVGAVRDLGTMPQLALPARALDRVTRRVWQRPFPRYEQYLRRVRAALRAVHPAPDVVVVHNDFAAPRAVRRVLPHARVITWLHNELPPHRTRELTSPDAVVAVSDYIRGRAIAGGVPPERVHTIRNGVDLGQFRPGARRPGDPPRALCVGRLDPNKGFHVALTALAAARDAGCRFDVTLAGARWWYGGGEPSQYERELLDAVAALGGSYVGLVPRDRIAELYRAHDLAFVLSLSPDPCPLTVLEAMASGCAVVAAPRGGIPELTGAAAVLVDPDDPQAVAGAVQRLLADPDELAAWRQRALARAATESWRGRAEQLVHLAAALGVR